MLLAGLFKKETRKELNHKDHLWKVWLSPHLCDKTAPNLLKIRLRWDRMPASMLWDFPKDASYDWPFNFPWFSLYLWRVVGFQGIPEPELRKLSGSPRQRLRFLGGHVIPCLWSYQLWVKDLNHESHLSHLAIIVGTYYMRKGLGKAYTLSI